MIIVKVLRDFIPLKWIRENLKRDKPEMKFTERQEGMLDLRENAVKFCRKLLNDSLLPEKYIPDSAEIDPISKNFHIKFKDPVQINSSIMCAVSPIGAIMFIFDITGNEIKETVEVLTK